MEDVKSRVKEVTEHARELTKMAQGVVPLDRSHALGSFLGQSAASHDGSQTEATMMKMTETIDQMRVVKERCRVLKTRKLQAEEKLEGLQQEMQKFTEEKDLWTQQEQEFISKIRDYEDQLQSAQKTIEALKFSPKEDPVAKKGVEAVKTPTVDSTLFGDPTESPIASTGGKDVDHGTEEMHEQKEKARTVKSPVRKAAFFPLSASGSPPPYKRVEELCDDDDISMMDDQEAVRLHRMLVDVQQLIEDERQTFALQCEQANQTIAELENLIEEQNEALQEQGEMSRRTIAGLLERIHVLEKGDAPDASVVIEKKAIPGNEVPSLPPSNHFTGNGNGRDRDRDRDRDKTHIVPSLSCPEDDEDDEEIDLQ